MRRRYIAAIDASARLLVRAANQILDFFRGEAGKAELEPPRGESPPAWDLDHGAGAGPELERVFLAEAPRQLGDVRDAIARRDHEALAWTAHRLKGSIANFAAREALSAAERLEAMVRGAGSDSPGNTDALWAALDEQCGRLTAALTAFLDEIRQRGAAPESHLSG